MRSDYEMTQRRPIMVNSEELAILYSAIRLHREMQVRRADRMRRKVDRLVAQIGYIESTDVIYPDLIRTIEQA